jgi:hypothetical protein
MARVLTIAIGVAAALAGLSVLGAGAVLVARRDVDPVSAAIIGGLALAVFEAGAVAVRARSVRPAGPGTYGERLVVLAGVELVAIVMALLVEPSAHTSASVVVVGAVGLVGLATLVGVQARRP